MSGLTCNRTWRCSLCRPTATMKWICADSATFLVDVQADEVDNVAHGCLVPFWFSNGAEFIGAVSISEQ
jgi:hypothetical protein